MNKEEMTIGFVYGLVSCAVAGWWGVLLACFTACLWALGGMDVCMGGGKYHRRILCPLLLCTVFLIYKHSWMPVISGAAQFGALSIGYGIPDATDPGSWLGRHFGKLTRPVWFLILAVAMAPLFIGR